VLKRELGPLPWLIACIVLVFEVVLRPIFVLFQTSRQDISRAGTARGSVGWDNFTRLFDDRDLGPVLIRTAVWVVVVVAVTLAISLPLAQFLDKQFPGRRLVRYALLFPWAASVLMTALSFRWMLNPFFGAVNQFLLDLNLIDERIDFLAKPSTAMPAMIFVAIFVSVPFTTYVVLAGLQTVPGELYEAAAIDGANPWKRYTKITLPLLRPAILVAVLINIINVFNSFPIIWAMTEGGPQFDTSTSTVFMYKLAVQNRQLDISAAMAVVNLALVFVVVLIYLRASRWQEASRPS
jgi:multiple sugar transport system permease protein